MMGLHEINCENSKTKIIHACSVAMVPVYEEIKFLQQARSRWKSDDQVSQQKIVARFAQLETDYLKTKEFIEICISPLMVCLLEFQNVQLKSDEQEEQDRSKIALYGAKNVDKIMD